MGGGLPDMLKGKGVADKDSSLWMARGTRRPRALRAPQWLCSVWLARKVGEGSVGADDPHRGNRIWVGQNSYEFQPPTVTWSALCSHVCLQAAVSVRKGLFSQGERESGWPGLAKTCSMVMRNRKCN